MRLPFTKMHGAGNDVVVLDATRTPIDLTPDLVRRLADRRFGIGADQVLLLESSHTPDVDFRYRIFNASGGEVEHCGNGARCVLRFVHEHGLSDKAVVRVHTVNRVLTLRQQADGAVAVDMGHPRFALADVPFDGTGLAARTEAGMALWPLEGAEIAVLSMGNPHAVLRVMDVDTAPVAVLGPRIGTHRRFAQQVNVGFLQVQARGGVRLRVHERGAGETLACGSGACAAVAAGIRLGWLDRSVEVQMRGGSLQIDWPDDDAGMSMAGPAETVFEGAIEL